MIAPKTKVLQNKRDSFSFFFFLFCWLLKVEKKKNTRSNEFSQ